MSKLKLALLSGGISAEREVSLNTGEQIYRALDKEKYEIYRYDPRDDLQQFFEDGLAGRFELVLPALHGPYGEDGKIQGLMEIMQIPYLFSDCSASAIAMNKKICKTVVKEQGVPVINGKIIKKNEITEEQIADLSLPAVIKPLQLGSSVGISIAKTKEELMEGINNAFRYDDNVLAEEYIKGRELTVTVMGREAGEALPVIEIIPEKTDWFDYQAKYEPGATKEICPAEIPDDIKEKVQEQAIKAFEAIGCRDVARADFIWDEKRRTIFFLEINTIPGMTSTSLVPKSALANGLNFTQFLDKLIDTAMSR
ncbi:MAG: D-alanine--D-alanine ligase family protein [Patescibacteria group bacterium]